MTGRIPDTHARLSVVSGIVKKTRTTFWRAADMLASCLRPVKNGNINELPEEKRRFASNPPISVIEICHYVNKMPFDNLREVGEHPRYYAIESAPVF